MKRLFAVLPCRAAPRASRTFGVAVGAMLALGGGAVFITSSAAAEAPPSAHAAPGQPAPKAVTPPSGWSYAGPVTLSLKNNGRCLDADTRQNGINGNRIQLYDCNNEPQQWWGAYQAPAPYYDTYAFVNVKYQKCLDQQVQSLGNNGVVQLWDCNWQPQQKWIYGAPTFPASTSWYPITMSPWPTFCLDADTRQGLGNNTTIQIYECNNQDNQMWHSWPQG